MNHSLSQFLEAVKALPLSKKISLLFVLCLVTAGFVSMFMWANEEDYQVLYSNLSPEDGGAIVSKLRERRIPYKVAANGTLILVPAPQVHELRLSLAGEGLPHGGNVGFEIFDRTDFRTTQFVQELNYRRALQGELARTINRFKEVRSSRVFIVLPKDSLFVEESRPASASIQLDMSSSLPSRKLAAIVHLVANAVEGLEPENVTVVDTKGRVIFKGVDGEDESALLGNSRLEYKLKVENEIRQNVQSMLEGIVGEGKAIVRVHAEVDFNRITTNQEEYDPGAAVVRSQKNVEERLETAKSTPPAGENPVDQRRGILPPSSGAEKIKTKRDVTTNYEINRVTKTILKPAGEVKRLSVAAVIDGTYRLETLADGTTKRIYVPRSKEELVKFEDIVKRAMGYNEDREDQVSVSSIPFSKAIDLEEKPPVVGEESGIWQALRNYRKTIINLFLVLLVFFVVVRPLLKGMRSVGREALQAGGELPPGSLEQAQLPESSELSPRARILQVSQSNPEKTKQVLRGWLGESE